MIFVNQTSTVLRWIVPHKKFPDSPLDTGSVLLRTLSTDQSLCPQLCPDLLHSDCTHVHTSSSSSSSSPSSFLRFKSISQKKSNSTSFLRFQNSKVVWIHRLHPLHFWINPSKWNNFNNFWYITLLGNLTPDYAYQNCGHSFVFLMKLLNK